MQITKEMLNKRICDVEKGATNIQTFKEFIRESEVYFGLKKFDLNIANDQDINVYIDFIDYLWTK
jgi:hypothetical protein